MQSGKNVMTGMSTTPTASARTFVTANPCRCPTSWPAKARTSRWRRLDVNDFIGKSFTTGRTARCTAAGPAIRQPLRFRADWFDRRDLRNQFKAKYGYDLGVPINWTAYEEIATSFTNDGEEHRPAFASTATWTTARRIRRSAGVHRCLALHGGRRISVRRSGLPMRGMGHPRPPTTSARRSARRSAVVAAQQPGGGLCFTKYIEWLTSMHRPRRPA